VSSYIIPTCVDADSPREVASNARRKCQMFWPGRVERSGRALASSTFLETARSRPVYWGEAVRSLGPSVLWNHAKRRVGVCICLTHVIINLLTSICRRHSTREWRLAIGLSLRSCRCCRRWRARLNQTERLSRPARYPQRDPIDDQRSWNDDFADAMRLAHQAHPDDLDLRFIFGEAILNRTPWRMWT
jgi:hypothetical protein